MKNEENYSHLHRLIIAPPHHFLERYKTVIIANKTLTRGLQEQLLVPLLVLQAVCLIALNHQWEAM
jgi:hypothetical protein